MAIALVLAAWTPTPALGASWSKPQRIGPTNCFSVDATIDSAGRYHLAATCSGSIRYSVSNGDGRWTTTVFRHPYELRDLNPRIATDGNAVYVAYSRTDTAAGACDDGIVRLAVYYRRRSLPDGSWSAPRRIGRFADQLVSLQVGRGTVHAIVWNAVDGRSYYETLNGGVSHRYQLPGSGGASLRIGADSRARIAYSLSGSIRYGLFNGSGFWRARVTGGSAGSAPSLALGEGDRAYLLWTQHEVGFCGEEVTSAEDGTYFATNFGGTWLPRRLTTDLGPTSLTIDSQTGRVHGLLAGHAALTYFTRSRTGGWSHTNLGPGLAWSPVIQQDPTTGNLLVAYIGEYRVNVIAKR